MHCPFNQAGSPIISPHIDQDTRLRLQEVKHLLWLEMLYIVLCGHRVGQDLPSRFLLVFSTRLLKLLRLQLVQRLLR